jgi:hypothetical protein
VAHIVQAIGSLEIIQSLSDPLGSLGALSPRQQLLIVTLFLELVGTEYDVQFTAFGFVNAKG